MNIRFLPKYKAIVIFGFIFFISCSKPLAKFTPSDYKSSAPINITFSNASEKANEYHWDFGDGTFSNEINPDHKYNLSGKYVISLTAKKGKKSHTISQDIVINAPVECLVELVTSLGAMVIVLSENTPLHRDNFVKLAESGYYDSLLFHRVINRFMIQSGDPESRHATKDTRLGVGGPGYIVPAEINKTMFHTKGALAAARIADQSNPQKNSSGSQFYIVHGSTINEEQLRIFESQKSIRYDTKTREIYMSLGGAPQLDQEYTVFGRVISGLEVIDKIAEMNTDSNDRPREDVTILSLRSIN